MISSDQEHQLLDRLSLLIAQQANAGFSRVLERLRANEITAKQALSMTSREFELTFYADFAEALTEITEEAVTVADVKALEISNVPLYRHFGQVAREANAVSLALIEEERRGWMQARELMLRTLSDSRQPVTTELVLDGLPKYLKTILRDPVTGNPLKQTLMRARASQITTPALRESYLQAIKSIEANQGFERLQKKLEIAYREKLRYRANAIAQYESHRAYIEKVADDLKSDDTCQWLQIVLSPSHNIVDVCDLHANLDKYGKGKGVYRKAETPMPPFHVHCHCGCHGRWDIPDDTKARAKPNAEGMYLRTQPESARRLIAGSKDRAARVLSGGDFFDVTEKGLDPSYRTRRLGDLRRPNPA